MASTTAANNSKEVLQSQEQGVSSSSMVENDEFLKKNTDCVYFLASPLTCKKGSECEYRHSEYARVNPRDCWYWLNGNCLNPKCSFRHPPLEGLVGPQTGNFTGPPTIVPPAPPVPAASQNPTKQGVPCIFFQKGYCLKGDRCPFMHGPNLASMKVQPQAPSNSAPVEAPLKKATQPKGNLSINVPKVVEAPTQAKVVPKVPSTRPTIPSTRLINGQPDGRVCQPPSVVLDEAPNYEEVKRSSINNGSSKGKAGRTYRSGSPEDLSIQNGRDADDLLRESSPGFDVLVDDKLSDDEYYHNDDQFTRMRGHEKRNLNEFDLSHQDDYNSVANVDHEMYHNRRGYDSFDRVPEKYGWDHRRASSERSLVEPSHYDRRGSYNKSQSPDFNQNSDLRQRLSSKQRRVNGLKSVVSPDYNVDEDRGYRTSTRDSRRSPIHETSRGHRLQGRIKLPRRSSPVSGNEMYSQRENERVRNWGRLSPTRKHVSGQQSRLQDRLSGRILEESREGRRINGPIMRNDTFRADDSDFAGPKSLSELKSTKQPVSKGKLRDTVLASSIGNDRDVSFEGPKPLSEILKRKRTDPTDDKNTDNRKESKHNENDVVKSTSYISNSVKDTRNHATLSSEVVNKPQAFEANEEEGEVSNKKIKLIDEGESSLPSYEHDNKNPEIPEGEVVVNDEEQEFDEGYDQGDGEYEYEQEDGEGYDLNEVENGEQEIDSMDEDDGDDFAKTLGVSF